MNLTFKNYNEEQYVPKFQEGGQVPAAEAPVEEVPAEQPAEQDPMVQLVQAAVAALQNQDCQMAMQVCQAFVQMAQGASEEQPQTQPVYGKGGKLIRRISK